MKRWTIILIIMLVVLNLWSNIYADELDEEVVEIVNDGRLVMNFIDENYSPVKGASVVITYKTEAGMIDIRELGLDTVIVLESDLNGIVVLNNLPYGYYEYSVVNIPTGYDCLTNNSSFFISAAETVSYQNVRFEEQIVMVATPVEVEEVVEEKVEPVEEAQKEEIILSPVEELVVIQTPKYEQASIPTQVNTYTTKVYNVDNTVNKIEKVEENATPKVIVEKIEQEEIVVHKEVAKNREKMLVPTEDLLQEFRRYRLIDCIKDKVNQIDAHVTDFMRFLANIPDDKKDKKLKVKDETIDRFQDDKKARKYVSLRSQSLFR